MFHGVIKKNNTSRVFFQRLGVDHLLTYFVHVLIFIWNWQLLSYLIYYFFVLNKQGRKCVSN